MLTRRRILTTALLLTLGCQPSSPQPSPSPAAPKPTPQPAPALAAVEQSALAEALAVSQSRVVGAEQLAMRDAVLALARAARELPQAKRDLDVIGGRPGGPLIFSVIASANIHGEREDCGCKMNPLGGLARHATLTLLAKNPADAIARKYWGDELRAPDVIVRADAGDLLFRSASLMDWGDDQKKKHMAAAQAVIAGLNAAPPDAVNVGELELALGWEGFKRVKEGAKFPFISANLRLADGSQPLPASVVVERGGQQVAFIGLTKEQSLIPDYWHKRGVKVLPAAEAYVEAARALPEGVDLVVLLSNLGVADTERLIEAARGRGARLDAALVSNTNSQSARPLWPAGVPMVELMSRGKYLGRLDLALHSTEAQAAYANGRPEPNDAVQDYGRKVSLYLEARDALRELERQIAEKQRAEPKGDDPLSKDVRRSSQRQLAALNNNRLSAERRLQALSQDVADASLKLEQAWAVSGQPTGSAWADWRAVPVKLDIAQHPAVRKALSAHKVDL